MGRRTAKSRSRGPGGREEHGVDMAIISHGKTPIGNSAHVNRWNITSATYANESSPPPEEQRARRGSRAGRRPPGEAWAVGDEPQRPIETDGRPSWQPQSTAAGRAPASRLQLRDPSEGVDDADLEPQQPDPSRERRCGDHQRAERRGARRTERQRPGARAATKGEEPVVVQVRGGVDQLDPPEGTRRSRPAARGAPARGDGDAGPPR